VLRNGDDDDADAVAAGTRRAIAGDRSRQRVLLQDWRPAVVDLAAMRNAMADLGGDLEQINR
jgi:aconitase A